jgi:RNA polymerase sigma-70 factor (ECF subfamily)
MLKGTPRIKFLQHMEIKGLRSRSTNQKVTDASQLERLERALVPHLDAAYNLARWLVGAPADADDVAQEACLRAVKFFDGFRGGDARGWLLAIVRNTCYDWLRKNRNYTSEDLDRTPDEAPDPETLEVRNADRRLVRECLDRLPAEYREALVLRELEELSYKEIAQVTGVPIGTVMSRLARARKRLEEELRKEGM